MQLIYIGTNAKTVKSDLSNSEYKTAIMYLAPADSVQGINVCAMAKTADCRDSCLYESGLAAVYKSIHKSRIKRTELFRDDREAFMALMAKDIARELRKANREGYLLAVRPNGTSDIVWESIPVGGYANIFEMFPDVLFYDYTKNVSKSRLAIIDSIPNYSVTASYSEANMTYARKIANQDNLNIAVVFEKDIPEFYTLANGKTLPVISGDKNDERYLDPIDQQYIIGLKAKGPAKQDTSGFVIRNINAHSQLIAVAA
jgi:hypothetical protein